MSQGGGRGAARNAFPAQEGRTFAAEGGSRFRDVRRAPRCGVAGGATFSGIENHGQTRFQPRRRGFRIAPCRRVREIARNSRMHERTFACRSEVPPGGIPRPRRDESSTPSSWESRGSTGARFFFRHPRDAPEDRRGVAVFQEFREIAPGFVANTPFRSRSPL